MSTAIATPSNTPVQSVDSPPSPAELESRVTIEWVLRIAVAGCFIGHGAFGVITKEAWLDYFAVAGIGETLAWRLMPWVGWMDIAIGIAALIRPVKPVLWWAVAWAVWTALLRPLAGESIWETFERAGNYGAPLALILLLNGRREALAWALRGATALLLLGHAGCNLLDQNSTYLLLYQSIWPGVGTEAHMVFGGIDLILAAAVLVRPQKAIFLTVMIWKIATESLWIVAGFPGWEFIERFGSYGVPLAGAILLTQSARAHNP